ATHQSSPSEQQKKDAQPDSTTGTARPTTPAPEPARPDADAQKQGAQPALPPAPAEKVAPPIKEKYATRTHPHPEEPAGRVSKEGSRPHGSRRPCRRSPTMRVLFSSSHVRFQIRPASLFSGL